MLIYFPTLDSLLLFFPFLFCDSRAFYFKAFSVWSECCPLSSTGNQIKHMYMFKGSIWQIVLAEKLKCGKALALWMTGNASVALWEGIYFIASGVCERKRRREKASKCVLCSSNHFKFYFNLQRCDNICTYVCCCTRSLCVSTLFSMRVCTSSLQCLQSTICMSVHFTWRDHPKYPLSPFHTSTVFSLSPQLCAVKPLLSHNPINIGQI